MNKKRFLVLIVLKNGQVHQQITSIDDKSKLKDQIQEDLKPYVDYAIYYGKEDAYINDNKYTLLYNFWWI